MRVSNNIVLNDNEERLRATLSDAAEQISNTSQKDVQIRFAGGWVRDKLLNLPSDDIDVAINCMTGVEFAIELSKHLSDTQQNNMSRIAKVEINPEKSKHLETARAKVLGYTLDFVNLRSEDYAADSRVPKMQFGTPLQDAMRRDCTVNALFYNAREKVVEDYTQMGIKDLNDGIIRTPLPAFKTFTDDPLRVLRVIRFASRFGFNITPDIQEAVKIPSIKKAVTRKVSKERIGIEVDKMLRKSPRVALELIIALDLHNTIFHKPENVEIEGEILPPQIVMAASNAFEWLEKNSYETFSHISKNERYQRAMWLQIALLPLTYAEATTKKGPKLIKSSLAAAVCQKSLKFPNSDYDFTNKCIASREAIEKILVVSPVSRKDLGLFVRQIGPDWSVIIMAKWIADLAPIFMNSQGEHKTVDEICTLYERLFTLINHNNLSRAFEIKPLLTVMKTAILLQYFPLNIFLT